MSTPQIEVSSNDRGPLINLANWITVVVVSLSVFTKVGTKLRRIGTIQQDDLYMFATMLAAVGHSVAVSKQVKAGLGQHVTSLTSLQVQAFQQAEYAAQILYVLGLCLTKSAVFFAYLIFARTHLRRNLVKGMMVLNFCWAFSAMLAIAFQCHLPEPWTVLVPDRCINQVAFWDAIGAFDIILDLAIILLPIYLLRDLQLALRKKVFIMSAFADRSLVIPLTILRLIYISSASKSHDPTFATFDTALTSELHVNLSIILACVPFLKPFVDSLQIGLFNSDARILVPRQIPQENRSWYDKKWLSKHQQRISGFGSQQWMSLQNSRNHPLPPATTLSEQGVQR